ncbi:SDR family NAD(P)-dependent oxidoreductase [Pelagibacterium lentulum]|nr:SDR family oxidoreductase [Pelagibacterium lentulum]
MSPRPLSQQTIWITGAAQGLGAGIARYMAPSGTLLVLFDYDGQGVKRTAEQCGANASAIVADLSDAEATDAAIAEALALSPRVDTVIHNAAILVPKPFEAVDLGEFSRTLNVGLQAGFQLASAVWRPMLEAGGGTLVFVSSRSGIEGFDQEAAYCAAKHGLEGFSKSLALEGEPHGILSVTVTPGMYMKTPMSDRNYPDELKAKWVDPERLAPAFAYLAANRPAELSGTRLDAWTLSQSHQIDS